MCLSQDIFFKWFLNVKGKGGWGLEKPVGQFFLFLSSFPFRYFQNGIFYLPVHWRYPICPILPYFPFVLYFTTHTHTYMHNFLLVPVLKKILSEHNDKKAVKPLTDNLPSPFLLLEMSHALWVSSAWNTDLSKYIMWKKSECHKIKSTPKMLITINNNFFRKPFLLLTLYLSVTYLYLFIS